MPSFAQHLACGVYVFTDVVVGLSRRLGVRSLGSGTRMSKYGFEQAADYICSYVDVLERELGNEGFTGDVCEIGPAESLGGGVLYRLRGAESVTFIERFQERKEAAWERRVAELLIQRAGDNSALQSLDDILNSLRLFSGVTAEEILRKEERFYDVIVSNSVLQHGWDPLRLLQLCYERLRPGGRMVHVVDLRPLGLLERFGELAWFETSPFLHRNMVRHTGRPNRVRFDEYRRWAERSGGTFEVRIRHLVGDDQPVGDLPPEAVPAERWAASKALIESARHRFTPTLRSVSADDLAVTAFLLSVAKPDAV